jgi:hypothetical protein
MKLWPRASPVGISHPSTREIWPDEANISPFMTFQLRIQNVLRKLRRDNLRPLQHHTMSANSLSRRIAVRFPTAAMVIIAVLILALVGGLFHHHETAAESAACAYCHAGVQTPAADLGRVLPTPFFTVIGAVTLSPVCRWAPILPFASPIPRAPPVSTDPVFFREGAGLA